VTNKIWKLGRVYKEVNLKIRCQKTGDVKIGRHMKGKAFGKIQHCLAGTLLAGTCDIRR
jgi:hypothetical protein